MTQNKRNVKDKRKFGDWVCDNVETILVCIFIVFAIGCYFYIEEELKADKDGFEGLDKTLDLSEYKHKGNRYCQPIEEWQGNWTICYDDFILSIMETQGRYDKIILPEVKKHDTKE